MTGACVVVVVEGGGALAAPASFVGAPGPPLLRVLGPPVCEGKAVAGAAGTATVLVAAAAASSSAAASCGWATDA